MNDYAFGNFLYMLRTEKELSQAQLGEMLGVTNKAVSKWENGAAKPNTKLLPKLAEILGVTVEELFAAKRAEMDSELENIKAFLSGQKKKYAIMDSLLFAILFAIPLLLVEFICVMMGFHLPDDVLGPLGAMLFILSFVGALVAFLIYRGNFRAVKFMQAETSAAFVRNLKIISFSSVTVLYWLVFLLVPIWLAVVDRTFDFHFAGIVLAILGFLTILLFATVVCTLRMMCLLKIKLVVQRKKDSSIPPFIKYCLLLMIILFPFTCVARIVDGDGFLVKVLIPMCYFAFFAVTIYNLHKSRYR